MLVLRTVLAILGLLLFVYVLPVITKVRAGLKAYETHVAYRDNYKLHTTPFATGVVADLCLKLGITESSEHCQPNAVVYTPDLFDETNFFQKSPQTRQNL
jgi:hypothetical protein